MKPNLKIEPMKNKLAWMKNSCARMMVAVVAILLTASPMNVRAAAFAPGDLALVVAAASANNTTCSVVEINTTSSAQSAIQTIAIPSTGANSIRISGSATSTAYAADSNDGSLFCFTGANSTDTSANVNTLLTRAVVTLDASGNINLPTTYSGATGNQTRCASTINNSTWFIGDQKGLYSNGTTTASPVGNFRGVKAFGSTVYVLTAVTSSAPIGTLAAATGSTFAALPGLVNGSGNEQDFYLVSSGSSGSTYDVLYVLSATTGTAGTIAKYSLVSGSWTANGTYTTSFGGFGLCATKSGSGAVLYISTGTGAATANSVIKITDTAGYNTTIAVTSANNVTLYTTGTGTIVKGLAFAPVSVLGLAIDNTGTPATGTLIKGGSPVTVPVFGFRLTPSGGSVNFTGLKLTSTGTATTADLSNFRVVFDADNSGTFNGGDTVISSSAQPLANPINFPITSQTLVGASNYLVVADLATGATVGHTFTASIAAAGDVTNSTTANGTASGNQQTIVAAAYDLTMSAVAASEAATISSLTNDVTIPDTAHGTQVWQVTFNNPVGNAGADTLSALTVSQGANNGVANWQNTIRAVELFNGNTALAAGTVSPTNIVFSGLSVALADGASATLTLRLSLTNAPGALVDNTNFQFAVTASGVTLAGINGVTTSAINSDQTQNKITVVATQLGFALVPTYVITNTAFTVQVSAQDANGNLDLDNTSSVNLSLLTGTGTLSGGGSLTLTGGNKKWTTLTYDTLDTFSLTATDDGAVLSPATSANILARVTPTFTEVTIPQFIQGISSGTSNTKRIPYAYRVSLSNLLANATYRYYNQVVIASDSATSDGVGNVIFASASGSFVRTTNPGMNSTGGYGTFTTDANGSYTGWFINEPTGNTRFATPGNQMFLRIMLNDGLGGTSVLTRLTTTTAATVIAFGTDSATATGIYGNSSATAKNFVLLYDNVAGTGRPLAATFVESDGVAENTAAAYASFYNSPVDGTAGAWGNLIPNTNPNGVQRIEQRALTDGSLVGFNTAATGVWPSSANTVSPGGGDTAPIIITAGDAPLTGSVTTYTITATQSANGSITPSGVTTVNSGASTNYSITPNVGYSVATLTVDAGSVTPATSYAFNNVTANHTITASFAINTYTVSYDGNGNTGGTAPVDASSPYNYNSTVTTKTAGSLVKTGYSFAGWNTAAAGTGTGYAPNATFAITANTTLFAQWTFIPIITKITVTGGNVLIDFTGATTDVPANFTVLSNTNLLNALATNLTANVSTVGSGLFRATIPVANPAAYYRIKH